jgi:hypothetical protein
VLGRHVLVKFAGGHHSCSALHALILLVAHVPLLPPATLVIIGRRFRADSLGCPRVVLGIRVAFMGEVPVLRRFEFPRMVCAEV